MAKELFKKRIRAGVIIIDKDKVVLLWRKFNGNEYFVFPGGGKEEDETLEEAAVREAFEETSLVVKVEKFIYKLSNETNEQNFFLCSYISGEPKLGIGNEADESSESNQYEPMWKSIIEVSSLNLLPIEIKDWFLEDCTRGFDGPFRELEISKIGDKVK
jgi:8-oxo-dGTP diphosphatase